MSHSALRPFVVAAACAVLAACSPDAPDRADVVRHAITTSTLGHPDGHTIVGHPAVAQWTDGSTYLFVTAAAPSTSGGGTSAAMAAPRRATANIAVQPPVCVHAPCGDDPPAPVQSLWYRRLDKGTWGPWTELGGNVAGSPAVGSSDPFVTAQKVDGTPSSAIPARLLVAARGHDGYLTRCYLETAPEDTVVISITSPTTFSYAINGQPAKTGLTIPVGGTFSIPGAHTDLVVGFPTPAAWQVPYTAGESYTIEPHQPIPQHHYPNLPSGTPDLTLQVTTSTWSSCDTIPTPVASDLAVTSNALGPSSTMLTERANGHLTVALFYGVAGEFNGGCSPTSKATDQACSGMWYDLGLASASVPSTVPVLRVGQQSSWVHLFDIGPGGELDHQAVNVFASGKYVESIGVHVLDPPAGVISPGPWPKPETPALDLFSRDLSGNLVRARNYSLGTLGANGADGGIGGQADGGVGLSGFWAVDAFGTHFDSAPAARLAASSTVGTTAALRIWDVYGLQGQDVVDVRLQEVVDLGDSRIPMPDPSCHVSDELQAKLTFCQSATSADMLGFCQDALDDVRREFADDAGCQATMRAFHFDIWLGLFDRVLPFGATKAPDAPGLTASLSYVDQFYQLERRLFPESAGATASPSADHARRLAEVLSQHAYAAAEAALEQAIGTLPSDPTAIGNALEQMSRATIAIDRQILQAAYGDGAAPITSPALLWITADRLDALVQRMTHAGKLHDLGCRFRDDCRNADTELAELWHALGALPDAAALTGVLCRADSAPGACSDGATAMRADWKSILLAIRKNHARLEQAALDALGSGFSGSAGDAARRLQAPSTTLPPIMQPLARLVALASDEYGGYASTGLYDTSISNLIDTGIQQKSVGTMLQTAGVLQTQFDKDLGGYKDKQRQYVQDQIDSLKAGGDVTLLQAKVDETKQQLEDVSADVEGIRLASRSERQREEDFTHELEALLDSRQTDPNMVVSKAVSFPTQVNVPADRMNHPLAWEGTVAPGDIVLVNVTGSWKPTCAIDAYPYAHDPPLIPGGVTGPEGYAAYYQTNEIDVHSNSFAQQHDDYSGDKTSGSIYSGLGWDYIAKIGGTLSQGFDYGSTDSQITSETESTSTESHASINMNTGLRLPNTPEPNMPVGSLLLQTSWVSSYNGGETPRYPHFLERQTAFVMPAANDPKEYQTVRLHLLVNDKACDLSYESDDGGQLGVNITVLQLQGNLVKQLGNAMGAALADLRNEASTYIKEGFITPEESTALRSAAIARLDSACNCDSSKFEASLLGFYYKWVDSEIAEISRAVELTQRKRTVAQLATEYAALQAELDAAKKQQAWLTLMPVQSLRGLASRYLATELDQLVSYYTKELYPAAKLRFPQTLASLASSATGSDDLSRLEAAAWDDAFLDWADRADRAAVAINTQFDISSPPKGVGMVRVVMRYPRDLSQPNPPLGQPYHVDPSGPAYLFPHVDPFASTALWNEVMNGDGIGHFVVRPDDLYNPLGGSARLDCHQSAPAIHDMVLVGVLPRGTVTDANGGNAYSAGIWNVPLDVGQNVMYPTSDGPESFVLDPGLTHYLPRIYFINEDKIDATLNSLQQATADAASMEVAGGISPFADFSFNLGAFRQQFQPPATLKDPLLLISEWMLVFDLETKNIPTSLDWLAACGGQ